MGPTALARNAFIVIYSSLYVGGGTKLFVSHDSASLEKTEQRLLSIAIDVRIVDEFGHAGCAAKKDALSVAVDLQGILFPAIHHHATDRVFGDVFRILGLVPLIATTAHTSASFARFGHPIVLCLRVFNGRSWDCHVIKY
jgi:hypothetical protein